MENKFEEWAILDEVWKPIIGYEQYYSVSNRGRVMRTGKAARHGLGRGGGARLNRILKSHIDPKDGYVHIQLWVEGKPINKLVHCLVAEAFLGPVPDGFEVNHKHGIKTDNRDSEIEYLTHSENNLHSYRTGLKKPRVDQMVAVRRKPRKIILCGCGCGHSIETPDRKGRERSFVRGHNKKLIGGNVIGNN